MYRFVFLECSCFIIGTITKICLGKFIDFFLRIKTEGPIQFYFEKLKQELASSGAIDVQ